MPQTRPFIATFRVYYEDTDAGGVMYHARYLNFFERTRTEWLRSQGINQSQLTAEHDLVFAIRQAAVDYHKPARLDDCLRISCQLSEIGPASCRFNQQMRDDRQRLLASAQIQAACLRASDFRPVPWRKTILAELFASMDTINSP